MREKVITIDLVDLKIVEEHIALITLNRSEAANAMSKSLLDDLNHTIQKVNQNTDIYCTIITGSEEKAFSAGADLKERKGMTEDQVIAAVQYIGETITTVENMRMPVIAALNGVAYGGGLELALACDLRIAADHVKMGLTEVSLAIIPGAGGTQRLPRLIGLGQAKRLIYTAKPVRAEEALTIGLVEQVAEKDKLYDETIQLAKTIASNGPIALNQAKTAINNGMQTDIASALTLEHSNYKKTIPTTDRMEGLIAFSEKRRPEYKGK
ncbi:enoyl-CoA hydratase/carnithine racemase [Virgibacillus natechei]|uniref:Enoyl-CoA hydratase/carnithine racemase n=1 Tax=Virgibacillus natechei TaxID=1216297 RepID=A0ABS4IAJ3_9BACI|nr:enoyl-CoA hydratase-related protein [Virgibacillus natechei]MBP1967939.1 enoyl-CoA hydratase/carnithine racemase [Virgibacillus natechei]UZD14771.1 enoyl-CoA hydratase-related protein [Virgibacillus natechei]